MLSPSVQLEAENGSISKAKCPDESGVSHWAQNTDVITNMANEDGHALRTCGELPGSSGQTGGRIGRCTI